VLPSAIDLLMCKHSVCDRFFVCDRHFWIWQTICYDMFECDRHGVALMNYMSCNNYKKPEVKFKRHVPTRFPYKKTFTVNSVNLQIIPTSQLPPFNLDAFNEKKLWHEVSHVTQRDRFYNTETYQYKPISKTIKYESFSNCLTNNLLRRFSRESKRTHEYLLCSKYVCPGGTERVTAPMFWQQLLLYSHTVKPAHLYYLKTHSILLPDLDYEFLSWNLHIDNLMVADLEYKSMTKRLSFCL
jgi:hypothetical protein